MEERYSMFNKLAMEKWMKCNCGKCEFCQAKEANFLAIQHVFSLIRGKQIVPATVIANKLLNPGEERIEDIIASTDKRFENIEIEEIRMVTERLRKCKNKREVEIIISS
jgi:hypothetical protein